MIIIDDGGDHENGWLRLADDAPVPNGAAVIVSVERLAKEGAELGGVEPHSLGLHVEVDVEPMTLTRFFGRISLISIGFPSVADGRGFSIARRLRDLGFSGTLRACGPIVADQYPLLRSCGFDEAAPDGAVAHRQPVEQWARSSGFLSRGYQRGYQWGMQGGRNILEARRQAGG